jgi:hypothetical protein
LVVNCELEDSVLGVAVAFGPLDVVALKFVELA